MESLLKLLSRLVVGTKILESGNLEHMLRNLGDEPAIEISDAHYEKNDKTETIFEIGIELGRKAEHDSVYRIEIDRLRLFFIGTEADIILRIQQKEEEMGGDSETLKKLEDIDSIEV